MPALDAADPELLALAEVAEHAECLERGLLAPELRSACERAISVWREHAHAHAELRKRALRASRTIATTNLDQAGYRAAVCEFRGAREEMARLSTLGRRSRNKATEARTQLEHDSMRRREHIDEIEHGREARARVTEVLSARLIEAVDGNIPLPVWFTDVLGTTPSPAEPVRWWEAAVSLLAYRITFRISDPSRPLGSRPGPSACARQRHWFGELDRELFARPLCRPGGTSRGGR
jgi:hypothetical protein